MSRSGPRAGSCTPADARTRIRQARPYLEAAELVQAEDLSEAATVATGNAVLAAIALLQETTGDAGLARGLREVLDLKDAGHYGLSNVSQADCTAAIRRARTLVEAAAARMT
ncbi:hypothetical protein [Kineococcus sp. SYSU DK003]|uniref:hypothetical protein n=1 Tax=Kineococcus sp. SYSU DK003 TaxID=3383124 RepID=UPI003D7EC172